MGAFVDNVLMRRWDVGFFLYHNMHGVSAPEENTFLAVLDAIAEAGEWPHELNLFDTVKHGPR